MVKGQADKFASAIIRKAIAGEIRNKEAAARLRVTERYLRELKRDYAEKGEAALRHGNAGRAAANRTDPDTEERVASLYRTKYDGFNFRHFLELLRDEEGIRIGYATLHRILAGAGIPSPMARRKRRGGCEHPLRPRRAAFGELLQADASIHPWFGGGIKYALHGAVDDATGTVMGLRLDHEETLDGYYRMLESVLREHGIPAELYTDRRSVFEYRRLPERRRSEDKDAFTQFSRCCSDLGIGMIATSVPQAKGRIERLWRTLQSRLMGELRLRGIADIRSANAFLPEFEKRFNAEFASDPSAFPNAFRPAPAAGEIELLLSVRCERTADAGSSFSLRGERLQLRSGGRIVAVPKGSRVEFRTALDGRTYGIWKGRAYEAAVAQIPEKLFNNDVDAKERKAWKPAPEHPWRRYAALRR